MVVQLIGEIIDSADDATNYSAGNISGDDDFVEGVGAVGLKLSAGTNTLAQTILTGPGAPYNYSAAGANFGEHIIMWFNTKTPINATTGMRIHVGNGTQTGDWNIIPNGFYKGGFITRVINTAANFDSVTGGWTVGGNPAQLTAISRVGAGFTTITSIMGSFNNVQVDQYTTGEGLLIEGGTDASPNTFEEARAFDEDSGFYGWWASSNGQVIGKGKLYIGAQTGSVATTFRDTAFKVTFADERVAQGFYEFPINGANTDVTWSLGSISAAAPSTARWSLTINSGVNGFLDTNGVYTGADVITLHANSFVTGTTYIDCTELHHSGAKMDSITVLDANTTLSQSFIKTNDISLISNSTFEFSAGHAIEQLSPGTFTFTGNTFTGYDVDGSGDAAFFNNSSGSVTININGGGSSITVRNGTGASTQVNSPVFFTLTGLKTDSEVQILESGSLNIISGSENTGTTFQYPYNYAGDQNIIVVIFHLDYKDIRLVGLQLSNVDQSIPIQQTIDRVYSNP